MAKAFINSFGLEPKSIISSVSADGAISAAPAPCAARAAISTPVVSASPAASDAPARTGQPAVNTQAPLAGLGSHLRRERLRGGQEDPGGEGEVGGDQEGLRSGPPRRRRTRRSREGVGSDGGSYAASSVAFRVGRTLARFYGSTLK